MDPKDLKAMEADPKFAALTAAEQFEVRIKAFNKSIALDEKFRQLDPQSKLAVFKKYVFQPPRFVDKTTEDRMRMVWDGALQGDKQARQIVANISHDITLAHSTVIGGLTDKLRKLITTGIFGTVGAPIPGPNSPGPDKMPFFQQIANDPERDKIIEYNQYFLSENRKLGKSIETFNKWTGTLMNIGEIGALYSMSGTGATLAQSSGLAHAVIKQTDKIAQAAMTQGARFLGKSLGAIGHATVTGATGMARDLARDVINRMPNDPEGRHILENSWNYFRNYFIGDIIANMAMDVAFPMLKAIGKSFKGWGTVKMIEPGITGDQIDDLIGRVVSGQSLNPAVLERLSPILKNAFIKSRQAMQTIKNAPHITTEEFVNLIATQNRLLLKNLDDGRYAIAHMATPQKNLFVAKTIERIQDWIADDIGTLHAVRTKPLEAAVMGRQARRSKAKMILSGTLKEGSERNIDVLSNLAAPKGDKWNASGLRQFVRAFLKAGGASNEVIRGAKVVQREGDFLVRIAGSDVVTFPAVVDNATRELRTLRGFTERVKDMGILGKTGEAVLDVPDRLLRSYEASVRRQHLFTPSWAQWAANQTYPGSVLQRVDDAWTLHLKGGSEIVFSDIADVGNYVVKNAVEPEYLKWYLKTHEGLKLRKTKAGVFEVRKGDKVLWKANSVPELLNAHDFPHPKVSSRLGPQLTFEKDAIKVRYVRGAAVGNYESIMKHLDLFESHKVRDMKAVLHAGRKGRIQMRSGRRSVEVYLDNIKDRRYFKNISDARKFFRKGIETFEELQETATKKGYRLGAFAGKFVLWDGEGHRFLYDNVDEVKRAFKDIPMPSYAPELTGLPEEILEGMGKPDLDLLGPWESVPVSDASRLGTMHLYLQQFYRPIDGFLLKAVEKGLADPEALRLFRAVQDASQVAKSEESAVARVLYRILKRPGGKKLIPKGERQGLYYYLTASGDDAKRAIVQKYGLSDHHLKMAKRIRNLFGAGPETEGLFRKFGVPFDMFVEDYLPRVYETYHKNLSQNFSGAEGKKVIMNMAYSNRVPKELKAFFKHQRGEELVQLALDDDVLSVSLKYNSIGHRESMLGPVWKELDNYLKGMKGKGVLDPVVEHRLNLFRSQIMGLPYGYTQELLRKVGISMYTKFGVNPKLAEDIMTTMWTWSYMSAMGVRPWMPIRNTFQIWTTLGPRIGNSYVARALRKVAGDKDGHLFKSLERQGIIQRRFPVYGQDIIDMEESILDALKVSEKVREGGKLAVVKARAATIGKRLASVGLRWYKNSDEFTRAVAYWAVMERWDDAIKRFRKGGMTGKQFMRFSGASQMPSDIRQTMQTMIENGKWNAAANLYATEMVRETMFVYQRGYGPGMFNGMIGKLFGMFGTYPAWYVENVRKALKNMSWGERAAFAARFTGNATALYGAFQLAGINARNFLFWQPAIFSGGPMYTLMNGVLATASPGYKGRQARGEVYGLKVKDGKPYIDLWDAEITRWLMPFGFMVRSVKKAYDSLKEGNSYEALLNLTSFPVNRKSFEKDMLWTPAL